MSQDIKVDDLRLLLDDIVIGYPKKQKVRKWWKKPILACAPADNRFDALPDIASPEHILPHELLPTAKSVVVFFLPFIEELAKENSSGKFPCSNWGRAYVHTNRLTNHLSREFKAYLADHGYRTEPTPATHNFDKETLTSRWSHKHLGYLSGLGRFGVNCQLITPSGCTGRMGSFVTEADLGYSPLVENVELCLHKKDEKCLQCVDICPVGALSKDGFDRKRCWTRLNVNVNRSEFKKLPSTTHVCGKCVVMMPCSFNKAEA